MKRKVITALLAATMVASLAVGCGNKGGDSKSDSSKSSSSDEITIGFSQVGAESDWRTANSESMKSTFSEKNGYKLILTMLSRNRRIRSQQSVTSSSRMLTTSYLHL